MTTPSVDPERCRHADVLGKVDVMWDTMANIPVQKELKEGKRETA